MGHNQSKSNKKNITKGKGKGKGKVENRGHRTSKGEEECRIVLEKIFKGYKFGPIRPDFLKNVTGYNLELDCYCEELKLAVEFQGKQHYEYVQFFHKNKENYY